MKIDGKTLAEKILKDCQFRSKKLQHINITPTLAVILIGDDPTSVSYIRQKQKAADAIEGKIQMFQFPITVDPSTINGIIQQCNNNPLIHGIIIQRPLPKNLRNSVRLNSIQPEKDVDGFVPSSKFRVPVAMAVGKILEQIFDQTKKFSRRHLPSARADGGQANFKQWIKQQNIVVIGRGETAGKPIADHLTRYGCSVIVIHSQTPDQDKQTCLKNADIIISCVGKQRVITSDYIKKGVILISVGLSKDTEGKLHGDYEEDDIKDIASFYTPTPGGVGPINVSCLMENLVAAASK